ncbi:hypothetical protein XHV734_4910 [Xanthomonas hortorum pv. vitians]|nr:hypothetical protein XHV734_4910 [Xanthomonas hortorum pv. vitians]
MVIARLVRRTDFLTFSKRGLFKWVANLHDAHMLRGERKRRMRA